MNINNIQKAQIYKISEQAYAFFTPVHIVFLQTYGVTLSQVGFLVAYAYVIIILLEVPSGYFADIFGRRFSLIIAAYFGLISVCIYLYASSFLGFLIAETVLSIGIALRSGADTALVYDTLSETGEESYFKEKWGKIVANWIFFIAIFNLVGPLLASANIKLPLYLVLGSFLVNIIAGYSLREPKRHKLIISSGYLKTLMRVCHDTVLKNSKLKWLIITSALIFTSFHSGFWFYQPYFELAEIPLAYYGAIFATLSIVAGLTARNAERIEKSLGFKKVLALIAFALPLSYLLMGRVVTNFSFIFTYVHQCTRGLYRTLFTDYINKLAPSEIRATVSSLQSMFAGLVYSVCLIIFSILVEANGLLDSFLLLALCSFIAMVLSIFRLYRSNVI